jgi:hypothetical protein
MKDIPISFFYYIHPIHIYMTITRKSKELAAIFGTGFMLTIALFFVDESRYSLDFLLKPGELAMLLFFTFGFCTVPIAIHGFVGDMHPEKSCQLSLFGFAPPLIMLCWLVFV